MNKKRPIAQSAVFYSLATLGIIGLFATLFNQPNAFFFTLFYITLFLALGFLVYHFIFKKHTKPVKIRQRKKRRSGRKSPSLYVINGGKKTIDPKRKGRLVAHKKKPS